MKIKDLSFVPGECAEGGKLYSVQTELGRITVLYRLTDWEGGTIRDVETGYKDNDGKFWLASGNFDITEFPDLSLKKAIQYIKAYSNTVKKNKMAIKKVIRYFTINGVNYATVRMSNGDIRTFRRKN